MNSAERLNALLKEAEADPNPPRYIVSLWHGEGGSIAEVRDTHDPDECLGYYSTVRNGALFHRLAKAQADTMNRAFYSWATSRAYNEMES